MSLESQLKEPSAQRFVAATKFVALELTAAETMKQRVRTTADKEAVPAFRRKVADAPVIPSFPTVRHRALLYSANAKHLFRKRKGISPPVEWLSDN